MTNIWNGAGFMVPVMAAMSLAIFGWLTSDYGAGLMMAAVAVWTMGRKLNAQQSEANSEVDGDAGSTATAEHSLFSIRMEYWAPVLAVLSIAILVAEFFIF